MSGASTARKAAPTDCGGTRCFEASRPVRGHAASRSAFLQRAADLIKKSERIFGGGGGSEFSGPASQIAEIVDAFPWLEMKQRFARAVCWVIETRPATTYDNFARDFGERFMPGYKRRDPPIMGNQGH